MMLVLRKMVRQMNNLNNTLVVMIDDNEDDAFITKRLLAKHGAIKQFFHSEHPDQAQAFIIDLAKRGHALEHMIILLDINMPLISGFDVMKTLRTDPQLNKLPIIMLSSSESGQDIHKSLKSGADGYLTKPFNSDSLFSALSNITDTKKRFVPDFVQAQTV